MFNLLVAAGKVSASFLHRYLWNLSCKRIQCDEIWSFVYAKRKQVPFALNAPPEAGDIWTWVAMCADTKLIIAWRVGDRSSNTAIELMRDLQPRLMQRVQLTTDGHAPYLEAVEGAFGAGVDYAQLINVYSDRFGKDAEGQQDQQRDPSLPTETDFITTKVIEGDPDEDKISTSYVEPQNLTMRMMMRRFTRKTNGFSKKLENHVHAVALHIMHYNFCRIHQSLRVTPAMEAGIAESVWEVADLVTMIEQAEPAPGPRGSYIAARARKAAKAARAIAAESSRQELSLTALMEPPMSGLMEPLTGADLGSRTG